MVCLFSGSMILDIFLLIVVLVHCVNMLLGISKVDYKYLGRCMRDLNLGRHELRTLPIIY